MSILPISAQNSNVVRQVSLPFLTHVFPEAVVDDVLREHQSHAKRERKLGMVVIIWWLIALHLYGQAPMHAVFEKLCGLWLRAQTPAHCKGPGASALVYRRYQLAVRPLATLFHRVCRPLAAEHAPGAFLFGLRLMAIDGQVLAMADTPDNDRYFGRNPGDRGSSAYPQARAVYLCECGTHAVVDAGLWPYVVSEHVGARRLLRRLGPGTLVMWDRGLYSYDQVRAAARTGAQVLCRLSAAVKPTQLRVLPDGSRLVRAFPTDAARRRSGECLDLRLIEYTLEAPGLPGHGQTHRLLTTLTDPQAYPAVDLVCAYHQRWEVEGVADEIETHQSGHAPGGPVLRSRKPLGVLQEFYGLLMAHYLVRVFIHQAAQREGVDPDRISFTSALRLLGDMTVAFAVVPSKLWPELCETVLTCIGRYRLPCGGIAPIHVWSSARCRVSRSSVPNTTHRPSLSRHSGRPYVLFERHCP